MRAFALLASLFLLTACSVGSVAAPVAPKIDTATPEMISLHMEAGVQECGTLVRPARDAVAWLPTVTLPCLGEDASVALNNLDPPLVVNVFQAGCEPCQQEIPVLQAFHEAHPDILLIGLDGNDPLPGVALQEAIRYGARYPLLADPDGLLQGTDLSVTGYPWFFVLAPDGTLTSKPGGVTSLEQFEALLAEAGVAL